MKFSKMIFFKKILIFAFSLVFTTLILFGGINLYLEKIYYGNNLPELDWTMRYATYDPRYVFWQNCFDSSLEGRCPPQIPTASNITASITRIDAPSSSSNDEQCTRIIFLGDSFSTAPFSDKSYSYYFSQSLAAATQTCVEFINIASGGVGTSQELARFSDVVSEISPNIVVWQFYWNDFYDNISLGVHKIKNGGLVRKKAWDNSAFWAGYLNQKIPYLIETPLGRYLSSEVLNLDLFKTWPVDTNIFPRVISYNQTFIPLAISQMKNLAVENNFKFYTTLSPLECEFNSDVECQELIQSLQKQLRLILSQNEQYISMEYASADPKQSPSPETKILGLSSANHQILFSEQDDTDVGYRHLSDYGENFFSQILYQNYNYENSH